MVKLNILPVDLILNQLTSFHIWIVSRNFVVNFTSIDKGYMVRLATSGNSQISSSKSLFTKHFFKGLVLFLSKSKGMILFFVIKSNIRASFISNGITPETHEDARGWDFRFDL